MLTDATTAPKMNQPFTMNYRSQWEEAHFISGHGHQFLLRVVNGKHKQYFWSFVSNSIIFQEKSKFRQQK
jgi:hypothetical protein